MGPLMQAQAQHMGTTNYIVNLIAAGMKEEDARKRARGTEGASVAWALGHLVNYRYYMMSLLGAEEQSPLAEIITDTATDGAEYPAMDVLLAAWNEAAGKVEKAIADVTDEYLLAKPGEGPHGEQTRLGTLAFYVWHEAYHVGQIGTLRKAMGYTATADMAIASSRKAKTE
ncbi:MAG: DinB family protein [Gemmatimonadetes bacterium]|nr:DinB family protein [Gemmatimonadota bacterium]